MAAKVTDDLPSLPPSLPAALLTEAVRIREQIDRENRRRAGQDKRRLAAIAVSLIAGITGVGVGLSARTDLHRASHATTEARIAACKQSNRQELKQATTEKSEIRQLTRLAQPGQAAAIARFLRSYDAAVDSAHSLRDCTVSGIEKYLNQP